MENENKKGERIYYRKQISSPIIIKAVKKHAEQRPTERGCLIVSVDFIMSLGAKAFLDQIK